MHTCARTTLAIAASCFVLMQSVDVHAQAQQPDKSQDRDRTQQKTRDPVADQDRDRQQDKGQAKEQTQTQAQAEDQAQAQGGPTGPATLTPDQARARDQMRARVHADAKLTPAEQAALAEPLDHYAAGGGTDAQLGPLVRAALDSGCKGLCLAEMVRQLNRSRHQGLGAAAAGQMMSETLRTMKQERAPSGTPPNDAGTAERLRQRVSERLSARGRERQGDRARDRRMDRSPGAGGGGPRGQGGGPRGQGGGR